MKYIRTKNGIYEFEFITATCDYACKNNKYFLASEVVKYADTIEELCDGFIITSKQGHIYDSYGDYNYELKEVLPQAREECPDEDWDLYGCILVNGIIKQVAKLNAKGVLELL